MAATELEVVDPYRPPYIVDTSTREFHSDIVLNW